MATIEELTKLAIAADKAGETADVQFLLGEISKLESQQASKKTPAKAKATGSGALRTLAQGITLGFGDEAEAYVRSTFTGEDRDALLKEIRGDIKTFARARPALATGLEVGGAILPSLVPAGLVARGALAGAKAGGLGRTALQGAKYGAAEGAVAGFGAGEGGLGSRLESAAMGGAVGGTLGAAAPFAVAAGADVGCACTRRARP